MNSPRLGQTTPLFLSENLTVNCKSADLDVLPCGALVVKSRLCEWAGNLSEDRDSFYLEDDRGQPPPSYIVDAVAEVLGIYWRGRP